MHSLVITAAALAVGFALPAAAQSQPGQQGYGQQGYDQSGQRGSGSSQNQYGQGRLDQGQFTQAPGISGGKSGANSGWNSSSNSQNGGARISNNNHTWPNQNTTDPSSNVRQRIYQGLAQAGFTDIHMMPRAYVVHAKDRDGNPVAMVITPNSVTALTTTPQTGNNEGRQNGNGVNYDNSSGHNSSGMMGNNGMNNSDQSGSSINSSNGNGTYSR